MRSAEFDRQIVLRSVITILIQKGYARTSMQDLKKATGLHPGSIYSAFESKRGLMLAAVEQFLQDRLTMINEMFSSKPTILEGLYAYADQLVYDYEHVQTNDCLMQKTLTEFSHQDQEVEDIVSKMIKSITDNFAEKVQLMMDRKEIEPNRDAKLIAQFFFNGVYGMRTLAYTNPEPGVIQGVRNELVRYVEGNTVS